MNNSSYQCSFNSLVKKMRKYIVNDIDPDLNMTLTDKNRSNLRKRR